MNLSFQPVDYPHAYSLFCLWNDDDVIKYTNIKKPATLQDVYNKIDIYKQHNVFSVIYDENVIGIAGCPCVNKDKSEYGLFYQLMKSYWGKGIATQTAEWLVNFMKQGNNNVTLYADVLSQNVASEKILQNIGFTLTSSEPFSRGSLITELHKYVLK